MNTIYRILDANFNRCREAFRVMEEYCRFGLNHPGLSARAKQLRHQLCAAIGQLDATRLLSARDTDGDVGKTTRVPGQLKRQSPADCFTAAAKRAGEALRALAEAAQTVNAEVAATAEALRFATYALEKDVVLRASATARFAPVRLYVLINAGPQTPRAETLAQLDACLAGGADCVQLRAKGLADKPLLDLAGLVTARCRAAGVLSIINDRVDIAVLAEADGVHLGQDDLPPAAAQRLAATPLIVGASTHTMAELEAALAAGYHYVATGATFPSPTKPTVPVAGVAFARAAAARLAETATPQVAIGGIHADNIGQLLDIGVRTVAVSAAGDAAAVEKTCNRLKKRLLESLQ